MVNSYKIEVELEQQTPIIHFQHSEHGATLRASEVKPKLDRFLLNVFSENKIDYEKWLIGDNGTSLNYKMKIVALSKPEQMDPPALYYGNMGDSEKVLCLKGNLKIIILCFDKELKGLINENLQRFFITHNFGRMQGKGFGSYLVKGTVPRDFEIADNIKAVYKCSSVYKINGYSQGAQWPRRVEKDNGKIIIKSEIFDDIKTLYGVMKSGLNIRDYKRSYLFDFCHEKELHFGNEKALMKKEKVSPCDSNGVPVRHPENNRTFPEQTEKDYRYVRAMLGVGDHIDYITGFVYDKFKNKYKPNKDKASINISCDEVKRYSSPITFKIINNEIYIFAKQPVDGIFEKTFSFEAKHKSISIITPSKEEFDIQDFFVWFMERYKEDCKNYPNKAYTLNKKRITEVGGDK